MNHKTHCLLKHSHPSHSEAVYCNWLLARVHNKEIKSFDYIFPINLYITSGKRKKVWKVWQCDFRVHENDGTISAHESKGWNRSDDNFRQKLNICMRNHPRLKVYVNRELVRFTPTGRIVIRKRPKRPPMPSFLRALHKAARASRAALRKDMKKVMMLKIHPHGRRVSRKWGCPTRP